MSAETTLACDIAQWYPDFKSVTLATEFVPLSTAFVNFLRRDGIFLPDKNTVVNDWTSDSENENWDSSSMDDGPAEASLPEDDPTRLRVEAIFAQAGMGSVLPKLNWKTPKDATWMTLDGSLRCCNLEQIVLLLKSSDVCMDALAQQIEISSATGRTFAPCLALRKWMNMERSMEFRCFVRNRAIIGVCQRDRTFYRFLLEQRGSIRKRISEFYEKNIKEKFPLSDCTLHLPTLIQDKLQWMNLTIPADVFDVYLQGQSKVILIDFAPFDSEATDSILFDWSELEERTPTEEIEIRLLESEYIQPDYQARVAGMPYDLVNLAANYGAGRQADTNAIVDLMRDANSKSDDDH